ncbi:DUF5615 family PIN-like protein [Segetibacter aerophilus]|uniref:DUF5615 domain-containing protein n=1 Tax=Segetibacter aerophilus TaxID=670293 RepID=A0A512BFD0_9BACT|nr:DUF5615 family PIN-like protein [Segetibacter aerophilus]GEO10664.1 hypothetical protein SAE01_31600 [Segetibacter aerophilus]
MKILLDENLPVSLKNDFGLRHQVFTVRDRGWLGIKNGALMKLVEANDFEVFVTTDTNLQFQQNVLKFSFIIVVLNVVINKYQNLRPLIRPLLAVLETNPIDKVIVLK